MSDDMLPGMPDPPAPLAHTAQPADLRIGSLCSGYGGLELGVQAAVGGSTAWVSDIDKGACKILAHRFPGVPNIGDMLTVDWHDVEPVDVLVGGTPCQDLSHAGSRKGMTTGTRSNLWVAMREAIAILRPSLIVWENVGGAYSARADSDVESEPGLLGDWTVRPALRALGRVLGDLASLGYVGGWHGIRAADVGAPHGRLRVFVVARNPQTFRPTRRRAGRPSRAGDRTLFSTPVAYNTRHSGPVGSSSYEWALKHGNVEAEVLSLLPTPNPFHAGNEEQPDDWRARRADVFERTGTRHGPALSVVALSVHEGRPLTPDNYMPAGEPQQPSQSLLPTPLWNDGNGDLESPTHRREHGMPEQLSDITRQLLPTPLADEGGPAGPAWSTKNLGETVTSLLPTPTGGSNASNADNRKSAAFDNGENYHAIITENRWGQYAAAIQRWEHVTGRHAPAPTEIGPKGNARLSPAFSEWMMGLTTGWVTDVPTMTRNQALKALGNGVVPQQAETAVRVLLRTAALMGDQ